MPCRFIMHADTTATACKSKRYYSVWGCSSKKRHPIVAYMLCHMGKPAQATPEHGLVAGAPHNTNN